MSLKRFFSSKKEREQEGVSPSAPALEIPTVSHPYVAPVLIPTDLSNGKVITQLNLELDFKLSVFASRKEIQLSRLIAPLANLQLDFRGVRRYKPLWMCFTMITAFGLQEGECYTHGCFYKSDICKGVKILVEADNNYEIDRQFHWSQNFQYLTDGLRTDWTMNGVAYYTRVNYSAAKGTPEMIEWLKTMGVKARLDSNQAIILLI